MNPRDFRAHMGMTRKQLAEWLNVTPRIIQLWEQKGNVPDWFARVVALQLQIEKLEDEVNWWRAV